MPVQIIIRTFLGKRLCRPKRLFLGNYLDNLRRNGFSKNCKSRKMLLILVARGGIEPPTHGFSVLGPLVISVT